MISSFSSLGQLSKKSGGVVAPTGPLWMAVGQNANSSIRLIRSVDGTNWDTNLGADVLLYGLAYGDGIWISVGGGSTQPTINRSINNGNTWITSARGNIGITQGRGIAYGKDNLGINLWVAVGAFALAGSKVSKSNDGINWTPAFSVGGLTNVYGVAYNGIDRWVAVGESGTKVAISDNGNTWTAVTAGTGFSTYPWIASGRGIAYGNNLWVLVGAYSPLPIAKSQYGNSWTRASNFGGLTNGYSVAYGNGTWVAVGEGSKIVYSTDADVWTAVEPTSLNNVTYLNSITYGTDATGVGLWVAVGAGTTPIMTSRQGNTWTAANSFGTSGNDPSSGTAKSISIGFCVAFKP